MRRLKTNDRRPLIEGGKLTGVEYDGQAFRFVGVRPHQRQDGEMTELAVWSTPCRECGDEIEILTSTLTKFAPTRRCRECIKLQPRKPSPEERFT